MSVKSNPKLIVELIPTTCHYTNVRTTLSTIEWDKIRKISYQAANNQCEICGDVGKNQGYKHNVECHEIWQYDESTYTQKLIGLISLCPACHHTKHIGRAIAMGNQLECFKQLAKVNKWKTKDIKEHITEAFEIHKERSKHKWKLDISLLAKEPYNIKLKDEKELILEAKKNKAIEIKKLKEKIKANRKKKNAKAKTPKNKRPPKIT